MFSQSRPQLILLPNITHVFTVGELRSTLCTKTPLHVRSGSYIKQMPLEHLSYIKQMPLEHLSYIKETSWNTSGRTSSRMEFTHGGTAASLSVCVVAAHGASQRTHDAMITSSLRQNDVNDVVWT